MAIVFNSDRIDSLKQKHQEALNARERQFDALCDRLAVGARLLNRFDIEIEELGRRIIEAGTIRSGAQTRLKFCWPTIKKNPGKMPWKNKPYWLVIAASGSTRTVAKEKRITLRKVSRAHKLTETGPVKMCIKRQGSVLTQRSRLTQRLSESLNLIEKIDIEDFEILDVDHLNPEIQITGAVSDSCNLNMSVRTFDVRRAIKKLHKISGAITWFDEEIANEMLLFKSLGKRRHLSFSVYWRLNPDKNMTFTHIDGPYWCQLYINLNRKQRNLRLINKVTREGLREAGFRRQEQKILAAYKKINGLAIKRNAMLILLKKAFLSINRYKFGDVK